jgi:glutamine amidotransferase
MKVAIVDYGMGNVASVEKALNYLNISNELTADKESLQNADVIILPGVGAFKQGMDNLKKENLDKILTNEVIAMKKPFLGICLGMQLIATRGTEIEPCEGLGWIKGTVRKIDEVDKRIPHLGWNEIKVVNNEFLQPYHNRDFYFIHSFHFDVEDKSQVAGYVSYGNDYVAIVKHENILATQFHPEKSQEAGLGLLKNIFKAHAKN